MRAGLAAAILIALSEGSALQDRKSPGASDPNPEELAETDLDAASGGASRPALAGGADTRPGYVGETEKNVWKAPAGVIRGDPKIETRGLTSRP